MKMANNLAKDEVVMRSIPDISGCGTSVPHYYKH